MVPRGWHADGAAHLHNAPGPRDISTMWRLHSVDTGGLHGALPVEAHRVLGVELNQLTQQGPSTV